jgi:hypothetical protein
MSGSNINEITQLSIRVLVALNSLLVVPDLDKFNLLAIWIGLDAVPAYWLYSSNLHSVLGDARQPPP